MASRCAVETKSPFGASKHFDSWLGAILFAPSKRAAIGGVGTKCGREIKEWGNLVKLEKLIGMKRDLLVSNELGQ